MFLQPAPHAALQPRAELGKGIAPFFGIGDHQLRRRRRRGRAHVSGKIRDGEIDLMTDAGDHRNGRGDDGARQSFIVERPEIFQ